MSIDGIGTGGMSPFGAEVVSNTLDTLNNSSSLSFAPVDKQTFGASVVTKTLDYMNQNQFQSRNTFGNGADYGFQKDVLSAAMFSKGGVTSTKA